MPDAHEANSLMRFPNHTIYKLNDGFMHPSPAFGAGTVNKGNDMTELIKLALHAGFRHIECACLSVRHVHESH